jgi:hypothetical protein
MCLQSLPDGRAKGTGRFPGFLDEILHNAASSSSDMSYECPEPELPVRRYKGGM